jgi:putative transposase
MFSHLMLGIAVGQKIRTVLGGARMMEMEVGARTGAWLGQKSPDRLVQRNGYRDREWETRAGTIEPQM